MAKAPTSVPQTKPSSTPSQSSQSRTETPSWKDYAKGLGQHAVAGMLGGTAGDFYHAKSNVSTGAIESGKQTGPTGDNAKDLVNAVRDLQSDVNSQSGILKQNYDALLNQTGVLESGFKSLIQTGQTTNSLLQQLIQNGGLGGGGGINPLDYLPNGTGNKPGGAKPGAAGGGWWNKAKGLGSTILNSPAARLAGKLAGPAMLAYDIHNITPDSMDKLLNPSADSWNAPGSFSGGIGGSKVSTPNVPNAPNTGTPGGPISGSASEAMQFFISKGWSKEQAAGIVGNLKVESGNFSPDVLSGKKRGDGGKAVGLAQWHPDRQARFKQIFGKDLVGSSFSEQLEFVHWELMNTHKGAGIALRNATSAEQAATIVDQKYEISSGSARQERIQAAMQYAGATAGTSGSSSSASTPSTSGSGSSTPQQGGSPAAAPSAEPSGGPLWTPKSGAGLGPGHPSAGSISIGGSSGAPAGPSAPGAPEPSESSAASAQRGASRDGTITTKSGQSARVASQYATKFQGFIDDLEASGYKIKSLGGFANRNIAGTNTPSWHAKGMAIDINPGTNPVTYGQKGRKPQTDMPSNVQAMAAKYGLGWGGAWDGEKQDSMHFSLGEGPGAELRGKRNEAGLGGGSGADAGGGGSGGAGGGAGGGGSPSSPGGGGAGVNAAAPSSGAGSSSGAPTADAANVPLPMRRPEGLGTLQDPNNPATFGRGGGDHTAPAAKVEPNTTVKGEAAQYDAMGNVTVPGTGDQSFTGSGRGSVIEAPGARAAAMADKVLGVEKTKGGDYNIFGKGTATGKSFRDLHAEASKSGAGQFKWTDATGKEMTYTTGKKGGMYDPNQAKMDAMKMGRGGGDHKAPAAAPEESFMDKRMRETAEWAGRGGETAEHAKSITATVESNAARDEAMNRQAVDDADMARAPGERAKMAEMQEQQSKVDSGMTPAAAGMRAGPRAFAAAIGGGPEASAGANLLDKSQSTEIGAGAGRGSVNEAPGARAAANDSGSDNSQQTNAPESNGVDASTLQDVFGLSSSSYAFGA
jgi:hypothetical protein